MTYLVLCFYLVVFSTSIRMYLDNLSLIVAFGNRHITPLISIDCVLVPQFEPWESETTRKYVKWRRALGVELNGDHRSLLTLANSKWPPTTLPLFSNPSNYLQQQTWLTHLTLPFHPSQQLLKVLPSCLSRSSRKEVYA